MVSRGPGGPSPFGDWHYFRVCGSCQGSRIIQGNNTFRWCSEAPVVENDSNAADCGAGWDRPVIVVSGLPRSGTSMMMQMLAAGGLPLLTDESRGADADNPRGYFELEAAKRIARDDSWMDRAQSKAVKLVSALLYHLPCTQCYKIIFMTREMGEVLASQRIMLQRRGEDLPAASEQVLAEKLTAHLDRVFCWLQAQTNMTFLRVDHRSAITKPRETARSVADFLGGHLDVDKMVLAVDRSLYRQQCGGKPAQASGASLSS